MNTQTQALTVVAIVAIVLIGAVNTVGGVMDLYSEWYAWALYALMVVLVAVVLRYQSRLSTGMRTGILAVPFVLAALGVLIGI